MGGRIATHFTSHLRGTLATDDRCLPAQPGGTLRTLPRATLSIVVAILLSLALALPASARQLIEYQGETSAPSYNRVGAYVLKRDNGRRLLRFIAVRSILTCEDASTFKSSAGIGIGRLGEDGSFSRVIEGDSEFKADFYLRVDGTIGFRHGSGTYILSTAEVTADGTDTQLCTTGELTWTVERIPHTQAKASSMRVPGGGSYLKLRVVHGH